MNTTILNLYPYQDDNNDDALYNIVVWKLRPNKKFVELDHVESKRTNEEEEVHFSHAFNFVVDDQLSYEHFVLQSCNVDS